MRTSSNVQTADINSIETVLGELTPLIDDVQRTLEAGLDAGQPTADQMNTVAARLAQVGGTLQLLDLNGPSMLVGEMSSLSTAVAGDTVADAERALQALLEGVLKIPDYLDRIRAGRRDNPAVLLPLINELRAAGGRPVLDESEVFFPTIETQPSSTNDYSDARLRAAAKRLRGRFQRALLGWYGGTDAERHLGELGAVLEELADLSASSAAQRLWHICGALIGSLADQGLDPDPRIKVLLARVERLLAHLVREGEVALERQIPVDLLRNLLYHVARSASDTGAVRAVKDAYRLDELLPDGDARADFEGPNRELLGIVGEGIRDDLTRVKDAIEIYVHGEERRAETLEGLPERLGQIADTFGMLGLTGEQETLHAGARELAEVHALPADEAEQRLQSLADVLLRAENRLTELQSGRGEAGAGDAEASLAVRALPDTEYRPLIAAVVAAMLHDLSKAREAIGVYCGEVEADPEAVAEVPALLTEVEGALAMLPLEQALPLVVALREYVERELIGGHRLPDDDDQILLADVVAGLEYYLEAVDHDRPGMIHLLESANRAVAALQTGSTPEVYAEDEEVVIEAPPDIGGEADAGDATPAVADSDAVEFGEIELETVVPGVPADFDPDDAAAAGAVADGIADGPVDPGGADASEPATSESVTPKPDESAPAGATVDPAASGSRLAILGEDVDEEIVEVFIEEALGELDKINESLPRWKTNPGDEEPLVIVRRAYHTLKGGGRLLGAELVGEFSWSIENMLNRVMDRSISVDAVLFETLDEASAALPQLIEQLQGNRAPIDGIDDLIARAHALSRGEPPPSGPGDGPGDSGGEPDNEPDNGSGNGAAAVAADDGDADGESGTSLGDALPEPVLGSVTAESDLRDHSTDGAVEGAAQALDGDAEGLESDASQAGESQPESDPTLIEAAGEGELAEAEVESVEEDEAGAGAEETEAEEAEAEEIDQVLLQIFVQEAEKHQEVLRTAFGDADESAADLPVTEDVRRALHTLVGSAQTVEAEAVAAIAIEMDGIVRARHDAEKALAAREVELLREGTALTDRLLTDLPHGGQTDIAALQERLQAARARAAADAQTPRDADENELLDIFLEEADELVEQCDHAVSGWRAQPQDRGDIGELQRNLHTLKGGARMANLPGVADLTHELESVINAIDEEIRAADEPAFELMQEAVDALSVLLEQARGRQKVSRVDWLVEDLRNLHGGAASALDVEESVPAAMQFAVAASDDETPGQEPGQAPEGAAEPDSATAAPTFSQPNVDQVRVQSELLDNLVNFAGEVSIYHSRLGEQMGQYRFNLNEFEQTVSRLRAQLRTMENETESQILFRHEAAGGDPTTGGDLAENRKDFDPLEFDRYTRLQELSRSLSESVGDLDSIKDILESVTRDAETLLLQQSRVSSELQGGLMQTRMVRFDGLRGRLARIVRQTAAQVSKKAQLTLSGGELELDRSVQERIVAPLEHIMRNAVSHGIEAPDERERLGKSPAGAIQLDLHRGGTDIVVEITDDGRGIDPAAVRRRGIERGLIDPGDDIDDNEIIKLILETGFSTAEEVTQISGRGVGMDVVDAEIRRLGGTLGIHTEVGAGTRFTVRLPVTLSINQAIMVGAGDEIYAIPIASVEGVSQVTTGDLKAHYVDRAKPFTYANTVYRLEHLGSLLGSSEPRLHTPDVSYPVIMIRAGDERVALHVDRLVGRREVVVKPLGAPLNELEGISGATIMPDGEVILILDVGGLLGVEHRFVATGGLHEDVGATTETASTAEADDTAPTVLVIDDSITIRKVTQRILARNGINVATAKDGVDALAWMANSVPDLILLDIEMPRMDGYEVATYVRGEPRLQKVPIIMITSRTGDKHRERAQGIGVDRYLGKPYQEAELMEHIGQLINTPEAA